MTELRDYINRNECEKAGKALKDLGIDIRTEWIYNQEEASGHCNFIISYTNNANFEFDDMSIDNMLFYHTEVNKIRITPERYG